MGRPRKFDYDECRSLYATGEWTQPQLAERYGVTTMAIQYCLHEHVREYQKQKQMGYRKPCRDCDMLVSHNHDRCVSCSAAARTRNVRATTLRCESCHQWKKDAAFPGKRARRAEHRRGRHGTCTACHTAIKRRYRESHTVPCSHGCGAMVFPENAGKAPECHPCAMARIHGKTRLREAA